MVSVSYQATFSSSSGSGSLHASARFINGNSATFSSATGSLSGYTTAVVSTATTSSSVSSLSQVNGEELGRVAITTSAHSEGNASASVVVKDGNHVVVDSSANTVVAVADGCSSFASATTSANGIYDKSGNFVSGSISTNTHAEGNAAATAAASNGNTSASEIAHSEVGEIISNGSEKEFVYHVKMGDQEYNYAEFETPAGTGWYFVGENASTHQLCIADYLNGQDGTAVYQALKYLAQAWSGHGSSDWLVPEGAHVMSLAAPSSDAGLLSA